MKGLILTICLSLSACGSVYQVDSDFTPFTDEFNANAGAKKATNLIIEYGVTSHKSAGATCYSEGTPRIVVDRDTWSVMSDVSRREVIFHEMGHCVLGRDHTTDHLADNCPVSIMNPSPVGDWCRNAHGSEYEKELFK